MKGLIQAEKILFQNYAWKVGNGQTINIANHRWAQGAIPLFKDNTPLRTIITSTVTSFILPDQQWNIPKIHHTFNPDSARAIISMELPRDRNTPDCFYWNLTKSGHYTTKSGYFVALQQQQKHTSSMTPPRHTKFFQVIWRLNIMPKWKLFLWKLGHNSLATKWNLAHRHMSDSDQCQCCKSATEDLQHLFRECVMVQAAWTVCTLNIDPRLNGHIPFIEWLTNWILYF